MRNVPKRWCAVMLFAAILLCSHAFADPLFWTGSEDLGLAATRIELAPALLALGLPRSLVTTQCRLCTLSKHHQEAGDIEPYEHPNGGPARILLMRHADKSGDPDDPDVSEAGRARAERLATYIPQTVGKPDAIIATARSKHSNRPVETVEPLASALGLKIEDDIDDDDLDDLVDEVFSNPDYRGKTVLICWHHGKIPAIAALLGAPPGSFPDPWPEDAYNVILDFRYDPNSGSAPTVSQIVEPF